MKNHIGKRNSVYITLGASNHTDKEREKDDYYATDPIAIDKLLAVEKPNKNVWECACGAGHLSERLKERGYNVISTDIIDRGYPDTYKTVDFLSVSPGSTQYWADMDIITNPPYKFAKEFVLKALDILHFGCRCYMFLKLTFLEGKTRYKELFKKYPPRHIYVFSERILCAKNACFEQMKASGGSAVAYAWYVWEKGYCGTTNVSWI